MKFSAIAAALTALTVQQVAEAAPSNAPRQERSVCARLNEVVSQNAQQNSQISLVGSNAYDCLREIPFDSQRGAQFVQEVTKYVQWQSDLAALKNPPDGSASNDILQRLSDLQQNATNNAFTSQVDFDRALRDIIDSANDEHFIILGLCTENIFDFVLATSGLVSAAENGTSQPKIYETAAFFAGQMDAIATINGQDPSDFLNNYGNLLGLQSPDARYNSLFSSVARRGNYGAKHGHFRYNGGLWQGYSSINYTYENGTEASWLVTATLSNQATYNYSSGQELFQAFCLPQSTLDGSLNITVPDSTPPDQWSLPPDGASSSTDSASATDVPSSAESATATEAPTTTGSLVKRQASSAVAPTETAGPSYYPEPILRDPYNQISGYYLNGSHQDTAVLLIPDFQTGSSDLVTQQDLPANQVAVFAGVASQFLQKAKADGKTKLMIDLSTNLGGTTQSGYNLFKILFPNTPIYSNNRYRNNEFTALLIEALSTYLDEYGINNVNGQLGYHLLWQEQVLPDQLATGWTSWQNWTGPASDDLMAATSFQNFSSVSGADIPIEGYGPVLTTFQQPPFAPEDILLITDGACASTCSIFVDLMMSLGNVTSTLAWGGLPKTTSMQFVGGVRGSEVVKYSQISLAAQEGLRYINARANDSKPVLSSDQTQRYKDIMPLPLTSLPLKLNEGAVNLRNAYDAGNDIPLQFDHQAAGCHLFYTPDNIRMPGTSWDSAADAWASSGCKAPARSSGGGGGDGTATSTGSASSASATHNAAAKPVGGGSTVAGMVALVAAALL